MSINGVIIICMGMNIQWIVLSGFVSYQWSIGSIEVVISFVEVGIYGFMV